MSHKAPTAIVPKAVIDKGNEIGVALMEAVAYSQTSSARSQQSARGQLGFSDLGSCREYIRATVAGESRSEPASGLKWEAFIGTWVGEGVEQAAKLRFGDEVLTQMRLKLDLRNGIVIQGSGDLVWVGKNCIVDLKSKNELATVRREGASDGNLIQVSGYLQAAIQMGLMEDPASATAHLAYYDRSGQEKKMHVVSLDYDASEVYLDYARGRLAAVAEALNTGYRQGYLRDEEESWCFAVRCPFFQGCWGDVQPKGELSANHQEIIDRYLAGKAMENDGKAIAAAARSELMPQDGSGEVDYIEGLTPTHSVKWKLVESQYGNISPRLYIRTRDLTFEGVADDGQPAAG